MIQRLTYILIPGLIAIVLFFGISAFDPANVPSELDSELSALDYEAMSEGIDSISFDANGEIKYTLTADRQIHYDSEDTVIENPVIQLYRDGESSWNVIADEGRTADGLSPADDNAQAIDLMGNVEIHNIDPYGNGLEMFTDHLLVNPELEFLETDRPVSLESQFLRQTSIGMFADLKTDEITFRRDTQGSYDQSRD